MAIPAGSLYTWNTPHAATSAEYNNALHDNIFQPPLTPATPYYSHTTQGGDQDISLLRKRLRADSSTKTNTFNAQGAFTDLRTNRDNGESFRATSPPPLANACYSLAGGFDTPTLAAAALYEKSSYAEERDFRRNWSALDESVQESQYYGAEGPLAREQNGRSRFASNYSDDKPRSSGWGKFVFSLATSVATTVAGKMWSFCREGAFRGFHAGEGKGYDFSQPTQLHPDSSGDGYFRSHTPVPGQYPRERDFLGDFEQDNTPAAARPSKRLHTDTASGWVFVDSDLDTRDAREASPRLTARKVSNPLLSAGRPAASRASSRRSLIPVSRRSSHHVTCAGSPLLPHPNVEYADVNSRLVLQTQCPIDRRASTASTRSPMMHSRNSSRTSHHSAVSASPLTPEAQKYLARKERQERLNDKSMRKMNKQLQDLIKQGNTALGTKYNVEGDIDDAFVDGDHDDWEDAGMDAAPGNW